MNAQDQKEIDDLEARKNQILANSARRDVEHAVKKNVEEQELYQTCKGFTNYIEKRQRQGNLVKAREARGKEPEQISAV